MSTTTRSVSATPEQVWEVLADGWLYPLFVVGASRMRDVDESWPAVGARLHHSVGTWPLLIDDTTEVLEVEEGKRVLLLRPAAGRPVRPTSTSRCTPTVTPRSSPSTRTRRPVPALLVPKPLRDVQLHWRNVETLRRLAFVVEGRTR